MSYLDDIWDEENRKMEERMKRNAKYFESLSDEEKLKLLWKEYVEKHRGDYIEEYEDSDWWRMATDSGGWEYPKYYVKKGAKKNKEKVLERIQREINHHEWELARARDTYDDVLNDRRCLEYV